jgi:hypothetical protein
MFFLFLDIVEHCFHFLGLPNVKVITVSQLVS